MGGMSSKEQALQAIRDLPEDVTMKGIEERIRFLAASDQARQGRERGDVGREFQPLRQQSAIPPGLEGKTRLRALPLAERQSVLEKESCRLAKHYASPCEWEGLAGEGLDE